MGRFGFVVALVACASGGCGRMGFATVERDDPDAPLGDAPVVDAPPTPACPANAVFCDGFEAPSLDAWPGRSGIHARVTTPVHGGAASLRVDSEPDEGSVEATVFPAVMSGSIRTRAWFYIPSGPPLEKFEMLELEASNGAGVLAIVDQNELRAYNAIETVTILTGIAPPRDRWFCLELHIAVAAAGGTVELFLDETLIGAGSNLSTLPPLGFSTLVVGLNYVFDYQDPLALYIDDVVAGTAPIGCD